MSELYQKQVITHALSRSYQAYSNRWIMVLTDSPVQSITGILGIQPCFLGNKLLTSTHLYSWVGRDSVESRQESCPQTQHGGFNRAQIVFKNTVPLEAF